MNSYLKTTSLLHSLGYLKTSPQLYLIALLALAVSQSASAQTYIYNPTSTTDSWTTGTNWSGTPVGGADTVLIFNPTGGTFTSAVTNTNTNDLATQPVQLNILTLGGVGSATAAQPSVVNINGGTLNFTNSSTSVAPVMNLTAATGAGAGSSVTYNLGSNINLGNALTLSGGNSGVFNLTGVISGSNGLTKTGVGAVTFSGINTYTGATAINGGTIKISAAENLGDNTSAANTISFNGGTLQSTSGTYSLGTNRNVTLNGAGTITVDAGTVTVDGTVTNGANLLTIAGAGNVDLAGGILGGGSGGLTKSGAGILLLDTANTHTGTNTLAGGTVILGNKASLGTGAVNVTGNSTLQAAIDLTVADKLANNVTLGATLTVSGSSNIDLSGTLTYSGAGRTLTASTTGGTVLTQSGSVYLSETAGTGRLLTLNGTGNGVISGVIADFNGVGTAGSIAKTTTSNWTLSNANTYSGGTSITGNGTLTLGNKASLGTGTVSITGTNTLQANTDLSGANKLANNFVLSGASTIGGTNNLEIGGTFTNNAGTRTLTVSNTGTTTLSGNTYLSNSTTAALFTISNTGNVVLSGKISNYNGAGGGSQLIKTGTANLTLSSGSSDYSGTALTNNNFNRTTSYLTSAGTTVIGADSTGSGLSVTSGPLGTGYAEFRGGTLQSGGVGARTIGNNVLFQNAVTISGNNLNFTGVVGTNGGATTLTLNNAQTTFSGGFIVRTDTTTTGRTVTINGTGNAVINSNITSGNSVDAQMQYTGTGTYSISGTNSYNGVTTIGGGSAASNVVLGSSTALGFGGSALTSNGNTTLNSGATLDLNGQTGINEFIAINGTGVGGNGALINSNTSTTAVIENGISVSNVAGTLTGYTAPTIAFTGGGAGTGAAATVNINAGTITGITMTSAGSGYTAAPITATITDSTGVGATATATASAVSLAGAASIGGAGDINIKAYVTGGNTLTKVGAGKLTLSSLSNNYTGATIVSAGTLLINGVNTAAGSFSVNGGTLGGSGSITGALNSSITLASGAKLAPGGAALTAGTLTAALTGTGSLDISAAVGGANTGALVFELGAVGGNSDVFALTSGSLNIGSGVLEFSDFNFSTLTGFAGGNVYTLFDTGTAITGTLGSSLTGTIGGLGATLSMANGLGSNNDLILTIAVPEPSTYALLASGLGFLAVLRRRMKKVS